MNNNTKNHVIYQMQNRLDKLEHDYNLENLFLHIYIKLAFWRKKCIFRQILLINVLKIKINKLTFCELLQRLIIHVSLIYRYGRIW